MDRTKEYEEVQRPSRIKLKETKEEKADRLYRREQRRHARESERISRANGYAVSPPRPARDESISPPRNPPKGKRPHEVIDVDDDDEAGTGGGEWMGGYGRRAKQELEDREWRDRMAWMAQGESSDPFGYHGPGGNDIGVGVDVHIPLRFRAAASETARIHVSGSTQSASFSFSHGQGHGYRNAAAEVEFSGGAVPPLGAMTEEEYSSWVREGMYRRKHRSEIEAAERRRKQKEEKERLEEAERERMEREEERRMRKLKRRKGEDEEKKRKDERARWKERWIKLVDKDGDIVETELAFVDIPWPIHRPSTSTSTPSLAKIEMDDLSIESIRTFMQGLTEDDPSTEYRKIVREAIRNFHPDRFNSRVLDRVREGDKDIVREAVGAVSGILNDLAKEGK